MNDQFQWWFLILGIAIGAFVTWIVLGGMSGRGDSLLEDERAAEAEWISAAIRADGGVAPQPLVAEILELHRQYVDDAPWERAARPLASDETADGPSRPLAGRPGITDRRGAGPERRDVGPERRDASAQRDETIVTTAPPRVRPTEPDPSFD